MLQMQGTITRDVVADVMNEIPELLNSSNEEKFVDVDAVLSEAMSLSNEDFVFDVELDGTMLQSEETTALLGVGGKINAQAASSTFINSQDTPDLDPRKSPVCNATKFENEELCVPPIM